MAPPLLRPRRRAPLGLRPLLALLALAGLLWSASRLLRVHEAITALAERGSAARSRLPAPLPAHRLLLATHTRLAWYVPSTGELRVLHEGQGVHYGMFPGEPAPGHASTVWVAVRPHNWRPRAAAEHLLLLDAATGEELCRVRVPARFTHDAVRVGDHAFVVSTGDGAILQLSWPDLRLVRAVRLFSASDHPNTLAAAPPERAPGANGTAAPAGTHLWVLLHNLGASDVVKVFVPTDPGASAREVSRLRAVGTKAHGLVSWSRRGGGPLLLLLDSAGGALVSLDPATGDEVELWRARAQRAQQLREALTGPPVVRRPPTASCARAARRGRSARDDPAAHGELAAFDLSAGKLLWRRKVATAGLLNIIGAPHLAPDSTHVATYSGAPLPPPRGAGPSLVLPGSRALVASVVAGLAAAGHAPRALGPNSYWSSGWPRLDIAAKLTDAPEAAGLQLPLFAANVGALRAALAALPPGAWGAAEQAASNARMTGRAAFMDRFKPGAWVAACTPAAQGSSAPRRPGPRRRADPGRRPRRRRARCCQAWRASCCCSATARILGPADARNVVRLQLARMAPGLADIRLHVDSGGYATRGHRIHVPLETNPSVAFDLCPAGPPAAPRGATNASAGAAARAARGAERPGLEGCVRLAVPQGLAFELNNRVPHRVANPGPGNRVHLVLDVFEAPRTRTRLPPGASCGYGARLNATEQLARLHARAAAGAGEAELAGEVQALLASPGMLCATRDGARVVPAPPASAAAAAAQAAQQEALMAALMASLPPEARARVAREVREQPDLEALRGRVALAEREQAAADVAADAAAQAPPRPARSAGSSGAGQPPRAHGAQLEGAGGPAPGGLAGAAEAVVGELLTR
ncbi:hypothetical protein HT031_002909 [Scenedesmus sp. PABB004]|nr:hypothetical protein HT031_002909 [Scenedesmus sp. PABB004]